MEIRISVGDSEKEILREDKGKNLFEKIDSYVCVDLETTGLDPYYDDIIEIGAVRVTDNIIGETFQTLVNPGYEIPEFITELTGITTEMVADAPEIKKALGDFLSFAGDSVLVGHNINNFDIKFLYDKAVKYLGRPVQNDYFDTLRLARRLYPEERHNRLCDLISRFGIANREEHRALADALQTVECLNSMRNVMSVRNICFEDICPRYDHGHGKSVRASDIVSSCAEFDEDSPIFGKTFVITGVLERFSRKEAMQAIADHGGFNGDQVTKKTDYLILGNNDYCSTIKGGKSTKQKKAEQLKLEGCDIEILSENVFYEWIK